jgi:hypothetical protein
MNDGRLLHLRLGTQNLLVIILRLTTTVMKWTAQTGTAANISKSPTLAGADPTIKKSATWNKGGQSR